MENGKTPFYLEGLLKMRNEGSAQSGAEWKDLGPL
jgi:hypothetical protein